MDALHWAGVFGMGSMEDALQRGNGLWIDDGMAFNRSNGFWAVFVYIHQH